MMSDSPEPERCLALPQAVTPLLLSVCEHESSSAAKCFQLFSSVFLVQRGQIYVNQLFATH